MDDIMLACPSEYTCSIEQLEKILEKSKEVNAKEISFSFIIGSLFPDAYEKIKEALLKSRIEGYNEAKKELISRIEGYKNDN